MVLVKRDHLRQRAGVGAKNSLANCS